jgi:hypothetical protein
MCLSCPRLSPGHYLLSKIADGTIDASWMVRTRGRCTEHIAAQCAGGGALCARPADQALQCAVLTIEITALRLYPCCSVHAQVRLREHRVSVCRSTAEACRVAGHGAARTSLALLLALHARPVSPVLPTALCPVCLCCCARTQRGVPHVLAPRGPRREGTCCDGA